MQGQLGSFVKYYEFEALEPDQYLTKNLEHIFAYDHDFRSTQNQRKPEFFDFFKKAFDNYIDGDWINATSHCLGALKEQSNDGPSKWMSEFLDKHKNLAPDDWNRCRNIDEKEKAPEIMFMANDDEDLDQDQDIGTDNASGQ